MTRLLRLHGWGMTPQSPICTVLTVFDTETDGYLSAPVEEHLLADPEVAEHIYSKLERQLRPPPE